MNCSADSTTPKSAAPQMQAISTAHAEIIRTTVSRHYGFTIKDDWMDQVRSKVAARMKIVSADQFNDYWRTLQHDNKPTAELEALVEDLLNHESQFNRHPEQLLLFKREVLLDWRTNITRQPKRIASLGCSTGEEAYSIAMLVEEVMGEKANEVLILGMDLSKRALDSARRATYSEFRIRDVCDADRTRFFDQTPEGWQVQTRLRNRVRFLQQNLMLPLPANCLDVIFCNNVLIYFPRQVVSELLAHFHAALKPHGHLFLGHADTLVQRPDLFRTSTSPQGTCFVRLPASQSNNNSSTPNPSFSHELAN